MPLRLATWNCHHGELRTRAALLDGLRSDIVALQECSAPAPAGRDVAWEGFSPGKGVGVRVGAGSEVALVPDATAGGRSARLFQVSGAVELQLLVFWAHREPTYVRGVAAALDAYATAIRSAPTVLLGDFNSNTLWDGDERGRRSTGGASGASRTTWTTASCRTRGWTGSTTWRWAGGMTSQRRVTTGRWWSRLRTGRLHRPTA